MPVCGLRGHGRKSQPIDRHDRLKVAACKINLGCDCSGIETPVIALENLGVTVGHVFSCDSNPDVKVVAVQSFSPMQYFDDVTTRDNTMHKLGTDVYVAGFPCQPFSAQGKGAGASDPRGRIISSIIRYIQTCKPRTFLLENVPGLATRHNQTFKAIVRCLELLAGGSYTIKHAILDAADHGIPQHRPRLFIVGIMKQWDQGTFDWPEHVGCVDLEAVLDPQGHMPSLSSKPPATQATARRSWATAVRRIIKAGKHPFRNNFVSNVDASKATFCTHVSMTVMLVATVATLTMITMITPFSNCNHEATARQLHAEPEPLLDQDSGELIWTLVDLARAPHDSCRNVTPFCYQTYPGEL